MKKAIIFFLALASVGTGLFSTESRKADGEHPDAPISKHRRLDPTADAITLALLDCLFADPLPPSTPLGEGSSGQSSAACAQTLNELVEGKPSTNTTINHAPLRTNLPDEAQSELVQFRVEQQVGATCGLHAVANAFAILELLAQGGAISSENINIRANSIREHVQKAFGHQCNDGQNLPNGEEFNVDGETIWAMIHCVRQYYNEREVVLLGRNISVLQDENGLFRAGGGGEIGLVPDLAGGMQDLSLREVLPSIKDQPLWAFICRKGGHWVLLMYFNIPPIRKSFILADSLNSRNPVGGVSDQLSSIYEALESLRS